MANVLDPYMVDSEVSFLDKAKIQAQVLVPVMRALREALGKDKADVLVKQALSGWSRQLFAEIGQDIEGGGRRRWAKMQGALNEISKAGVDSTEPVRDTDKLEFDVTRCRYAEFFKELNEPELGALLMCSTDFDIAATSEGTVTLTREQTIMQGGASCTFRYKFAPR
ncbi:MAG: L-2-amino-thiazoline-4-carboxylic acid hydrolase [Reyranella sp.]|uniref:L-2-amino-thiazoline-4-carboxylic acid hydrolase n=1 Tax=Reyranella sp. TaxID=1929291 RepID=UPI001AD5AB0D|nr:L-2-amino-thiazoline-4-carboxylic acid hydrolase [Reyranella sp.]MBN9087442.1 L-2-amino-thiazoline-4-carboxylic acid hydrolase [Reyranella sp.]